MLFVVIVSLVLLFYYILHTNQTIGTLRYILFERPCMEEEMDKIPTRFDAKKAKQVKSRLGCCPWCGHPIRKKKYNYCSDCGNRLTEIDASIAKDQSKVPKKWILRANKLKKKKKNDETVRDTECRGEL